MIINQSLCCVGAPRLPVTAIGLRLFCAGDIQIFDPEGQ
jgi:hypothetical protein